MDIKDSGIDDNLRIVYKREYMDWYFRVDIVFSVSMYSRKMRSFERCVFICDGDLRCIWSDIYEKFIVRVVFDNENLYENFKSLISRI